MPQPIVINGITMPQAKSLTVTKEKIWSKNAGRAADDGKMIGDIIGCKYKLQIQWGLLSEGDTTKIDEAVSPAFFNVTFLAPGSNTRVTKSFYAGTPTYPVYSYAEGVKTYQGVSVDLIEQ